MKLFTLLFLLLLPLQSFAALFLESPEGQPQEIFRVPPCSLCKAEGIDIGGEKKNTSLRA